MRYYHTILQDDYSPHLCYVVQVELVFGMGPVFMGLRMPKAVELCLN